MKKLKTFLSGMLAMAMMVAMTCTALATNAI